MDGASKPRKKGNMKRMKKVLLGCAVLGAAATSQAATDITGVINDVSGYADAAIVVGVTVVLFVLGRRVIKRLV